MMKKEYTNGPWHHDEYGHICAGPQIIGIAYQFELDDSDYDELPCIPNARLMAASAELFEILDALLGFDSAASYRARTRGYQLIKELKKANK